MRHHFASGLVVGNNPRRWRVDAELDRFAVDFDVVTKLDALPDMSRFIVDRDTAFHDHLFHLQARSHPGLSQHLVQLGCFRLRCQHAFYRKRLDALLLGVELPRHHLVKATLGCCRLQHFGLSQLCGNCPWFRRLQLRHNAGRLRLNRRVVNDCAHGGVPVKKIGLPSASTVWTGAMSSSACKSDTCPASACTAPSCSPGLSIGGS